MSCLMSAATVRVGGWVERHRPLARYTRYGQECWKGKRGIFIEAHNGWIKVQVSWAGKLTLRLTSRVDHRAAQTSLIWPSGSFFL